MTNIQPESDDLNDLETADSTDTAEGELDKLRIDLQDASDRLMRSQAELENYRKRSRRELEDSIRYASLPLIRDLLPTIDNLSRALATADNAAGAGPLRDGIKMVQQSINSILERHDCKRIEALGKPFDPTYHEAISQHASADHPPQTVLIVAQEGYMLHDRVVRPAQVIVSTQTE